MINLRKKRNKPPKAPTWQRPAARVSDTPTLVRAKGPTNPPSATTPSPGGYNADHGSVVPPGNRPPDSVISDRPGGPNRVIKIPPRPRGPNPNAKPPKYVVPNTPESMLMREDADRVWAQKQEAYRDALYQAALAYGDPDLIDNYGDRVEQEANPNSALASIPREKALADRNLAEGMNSNNTFFSGLHGQSSEKVSNAATANLAAAFKRWQQGFDTEGASLFGALGDRTSKYTEAANLDKAADDKAHEGDQLPFHKFKPKPNEVKRFDKNKDGKLDKKETKAAKKHRKDYVKKTDINEDGKVDKKEKAYSNALRKRHKRRAKAEMGHEGRDYSTGEGSGGVGPPEKKKKDKKKK